MIYKIIMAFDGACQLRGICVSSDIVTAIDANLKVTTEKVDFNED